MDAHGEDQHLPQPRLPNAKELGAQNNFSCETELETGGGNLLIFIQWSIQVFPNSSGRFTPIQSRKASIKLFQGMKELSTFTLLENTAYVKFITVDAGANVSTHFCL